jgi:hypothetical protein
MDLGMITAAGSGNRLCGEMYAKWRSVTATRRHVCLVATVKGRGL